MNFFQTIHLSQTSIDTYNIRINKWINLVPTKNIQFIIFFPDVSIKLLLRYLKNGEKIESKNNICTPTNIHLYLSAIIAFLKYSENICIYIPDRVDYFNLWTNICEQNSKPIRERRFKQMPTVNQELRGGSKLTFQHLIEKRDSPELSHFQHLLLSMYTYIYPVRADYFSTELIKNDEIPNMPNYIRFKDGYAELMLTDFKTVKRFKHIHYPKLPDKLYAVILKSITEHPRKYLFECEGCPYSRNRFSNWASEQLRIIFKVDLNLTMIRHLFISTISMELPAEELQKIGNLMGHSLSIQKLYKWHNKPDSDNSDNDIIN